MESVRTDIENQKITARLRVTLSMLIGICLDIGFSKEKLLEMSKCATFII
jgi:hypothetical protein